MTLGDKSMKASALGQQGFAGTYAPAAPPPAHNLSEVESQLADAIARVDSILGTAMTVADSLLGPEPDDPTNEACQPIRCGRIGGFEDRHARLSHLLISLRYQVGRIERATQ